MRLTSAFFTQRLRKNEGFTLLELVVVIAALCILSSISIPAFLGFIERAATRAAQYSLHQAHRECRTKVLMGAANPTYIIPANNAYFQFPDLGRDGFCSDPATGNILTAARTDGSQLASLYNLNINVVTGEKSTDRNVPNWVSWGNAQNDVVVAENSTINPDDDCPENRLIMARYTMNVNGTIPPLIGGGRGYHYKNIPGICPGPECKGEPDGFSHHQDMYLIGVFERDTFKEFDDVDQPGKQIFTSRQKLINYMEDHFEPPVEPPADAPPWRKQDYEYAPKTTEEYVDGFLDIYSNDSGGEDFFCK